MRSINQAPPLPACTNQRDRPTTQQRNNRHKAAKAGRLNVLNLLASNIRAAYGTGAGDKPPVSAAAGGAGGGAAGEAATAAPGPPPAPLARRYYRHDEAAPLLRLAPTPERALRAFVNAANLKACTPLMLAARAGHADIVEWLLRHGADPLARDRARQQTALHYAALGGSEECARLIIGAADATAPAGPLPGDEEDYRDDGGEESDSRRRGGGARERLTPDLSPQRLRLPSPVAAAAAAAVAAAAAPRAPPPPLDPPAYAGQRRRQQERERARRARGGPSEREALVGATTYSGLTALHYAAHEGHAGVAKLLLDHGADACAAADFPDLDWGSATAGDTPLHVAAARGSLEVVRALLKGFAENSGLLCPARAPPRRARDPRGVRNDQGRLAYHVALRRRHAWLSELLDPAVPIRYLLAGEAPDAGGALGPPRLAALAARALHAKLLADLEAVRAAGAAAAAAGGAESGGSNSSSGGGGDARAELVNGFQAAVLAEAEARGAQRRWSLSSGCSSCRRTSSSGSGTGTGAGGSVGGSVGGSSGNSGDGASVVEAAAEARDSGEAAALPAAVTVTAAAAVPLPASVASDSEPLPALATAPASEPAGAVAVLLLDCSQSGEHGSRQLSDDGAASASCDGAEVTVVVADGAAVDDEIGGCCGRQCGASAGEPVDAWGSDCGSSSSSDAPAAPGDACAPGAVASAAAGAPCSQAASSSGRGDNGDAIGGNACGGEAAAAAAAAAPAAPAAAAACVVTADDDGAACGICLDAPPVACILPCRHALCVACARDLTKRYSMATCCCPFCRALVSGYRAATAEEMRRMQE